MSKQQLAITHLLLGMPNLPDTRHSVRDGQNGYVSSHTLWEWLSR